MLSLTVSNSKRNNLSTHIYPTISESEIHLAIDSFKVIFYLKGLSTNHVNTFLGIPKLPSLLVTDFENNKDKYTFQPYIFILM